MTFRAMAIVLGIAAMMIAIDAHAQDPPDVKVESEQTAARERDSDSAEVGFIAKARRWAEEKRLGERLAPREGLYARFGGMTTGSGLALGAGYRKYFLEERIFGDVSAALSTKLYKAVDARARWAQFWNNRIEIWTEFQYRDYPQEDYFGPGEGSTESARTSYAIESTDIVGRAVARVRPWLSVGTDVGFFNPTLDPGKDDNFPSIEQLFTDRLAPGLGEPTQPNFVHTTVFAEVDYRDRPNATRGGFYRVSFGTWEDVTLESYDHHRFDAGLSQFFPLAPRHVIAARVGLSYVNNETGHRVPFYFLPYIGGSDTVRGYHEFRFRDENILFFNFEYRWQIGPYVHIAPFFDAGEVRADWQEIGPRDLRTSYGIGVRAGAEGRVFVRIDVGTGGGEGTRLFFKFGPAF